MSRIAATSCWLFVAVACLLPVTALADTHYVSLSGNHVTPFTNWVDAANNIQAAVDVASSNDVVLVTNGVYDSGGTVTPGYAITNRVLITTPDPDRPSVEELPDAIRYRLESGTLIRT